MNFFSCFQIFLYVFLTNKYIVNQSYIYNVQNSKSVKTVFYQNFSYVSFLKIKKTNCLAKCNRNDTCNSLIFSTTSLNCVLFRNYPNLTTDLIYDGKSILYIKNGKLFNSNQLENLI